MKRVILTISAAVLLSAVLPATAQTTTNPPPAYDKLFKNDRDKRGYAIGVNFATSLKSIIVRQEMDVDYDSVVRGFRDYLTGTSQLITEQEEKEILNQFQAELTRAKYEKHMRELTMNKQQGDAFMATNKLNPAVKTTADGLQYLVLTPGPNPTAASPSNDDIITFKYHYRHLDGTEFESSGASSNSVDYPLNKMIMGWREGIQMMTPGAKYRLFIPPVLAYGEMGHGTNIGPQQTLMFDIELISFRHQAPPPEMVSPIIKVPSAEEMAHGAQITTLSNQADIDREKANFQSTNRARLNR